ARRALRAFARDDSVHHPAARPATSGASRVSKCNRTAFCRTEAGSLPEVPPRRFDRPSGAAAQPEARDDLPHYWPDSCGTTARTAGRLHGFSGVPQTERRQDDPGTAAGEQQAVDDVASAGRAAAVFGEP